MKKTWINISIVTIIIALGIYLRLDAYIINNSFFTDEVLLFANIFSSDYLKLFQPLNYYQSAPYLFLVISKFISLFGITELCMRFVPFLSGIISVFMFYKLSKLIFKTKTSLYISLFAFCTNYQLLFYSQTFKQYSSDVLIAVSFLWYVISRYEKLTDWKNFSVLGILSLLGIYFSFPMLLIVPAVYFAIFILKREQIKKLIYSLLYPFFGLLIYYIFNFRFLNNSEYFHTYWQKGFLIFSPDFYSMNFEFLFRYYSFPILLTILLILGFYHLYRNNKFVFWSLFFIIFNTLLAAFLKIYPCERRLILFLIPVILIISVYPLDNLRKKALSYFICAISCIFFLSGYCNFFKNYIQGKVSYLRQDVKPLLKMISQKEQNENVFVYYGAISTYSYYSLIQNLPKAHFATYPKDEKLSENFLINDIKKLPKGTYLILFVKGTDTYEKDLSATEKWLKENYKISETYKLKSAALLKIKIH